MEDIFLLFHFSLFFVEEMSHSRPMAQVELIPRMGKTPRHSTRMTALLLNATSLELATDSVVFRTWEGHGFNSPHSTAATCPPSAGRSHACLPLHLVLNCDILHHADVFISVVVSFMVTLCNKNMRWDSGRELLRSAPASYPNSLK